jgi:glycosyltransferase involved in cell wall biosynthesis
MHLGRPEFAMSYIFRLLSDAQAVIAATPTERNVLVKRGVPERLLHTVPLGVDREFFGGGDRASARLRLGLTDGEVVILCPKKSEPKGIFHSLEAVRLLSWTEQPVVVLLLGSTPWPLVRRMRHAVSKLETLGIRVIDLGYLPYRDLPDIYSACDILLQPSSVESFGLVYLEAWASRKPVVAADVGGVKDVISDRVDGLLVPFGAVGQIRDQLRILLSDPEFGKRLGNNGYQKVRSQFDWSSVWKQTLSIYNSVI